MIVIRLSLDDGTMAYKIFIEAGVLLPKKYRKKVEMFEIVRGIKTKFKFRFENLGKTTFPGGEILNSKIDFESLNSMLRINSAQEVKKPKIPKLKKGEKYDILLDFTPLLPGPHSVKLQIKAKDGQDIEYYTTSKGEPSEENWSLIMYIIDRESIDLLILLEECLSKNKKN